MLPKSGVERPVQPEKHAIGLVLGLKHQKNLLNITPTTLIHLITTKTYLNHKISHSNMNLFLLIQTKTIFSYPHNLGAR